MTRSRQRSSGGELLFRWRSYLPLLAVGGLAVGLARGGAASTVWIRAGLVGGLSLAALGLALRLFAVGQAPAGTSGRHRRQHAAALNTFGLYSVLRHPLYLGNVLIWAGVSWTTGWPVGAAASTALGAAMFAAIARHEDAYLRRSFGNRFEEWATVTPAFIPKPALWRPARRSFDWARAVASEYSTLHSIGLLALLFTALRGWSETPSVRPSALWWALLAANGGLYLALRAWRARRKRTTRTAA